MGIDTYGFLLLVSLLMYPLMSRLLWAASYMYA